MNISAGFNRFRWVVVLAAVAALVTWAGYFLFRKFLHDRTAYFAGPTRVRRVTPGRETKTYTKQELDQMRREGKTPGTPAAQPMIPSPTNAASDAAIQQSLRTIQEINRINEMNRRLMDEQQRNQRQQR